MTPERTRKVAEICQRYGILVIDVEPVTLSILTGRSPLCPSGPKDNEGIDWATCTLYVSRASNYFDAMHEVAHLVWHESPHESSEAKLLGLESIFHKACGTHRQWVATYLKGMDVYLPDYDSAQLPVALRRAFDADMPRGSNTWTFREPHGRELLQHLESVVVKLGYAKDLSTPCLVSPRLQRQRWRNVAKLLKGWARQIVVAEDQYLHVPGQHNNNA